MIDLADFDFPEHCRGLHCPALQAVLEAENSLGSEIIKTYHFTSPHGDELSESTFHIDTEEQEIRSRLFITELITRCQEERLKRNRLCGTMPDNIAEIEIRE